MTVEQLRNIGNIVVGQTTYKNPLTFFPGLEDTIESIKGNNNRFLIKLAIEEKNSYTSYMNVVYAVDLKNPIFKVYFSVFNNGIEFVSNRIYIAYNVTTEGSFDLSLIEKPDIDTMIADIQHYRIRPLNRTDFERFIGIGCVFSINKTINKRGHLSKLSPSIFIDIAKFFKKNETINIENIIQMAFNEIEINEIISEYEKKLIFQEILDYFISN